jgi:uncharacterized protein (DUF1778 family)
MRGRPPKPKSDRRTNHLHVLLTDDERELLDKAADLKAMDISGWARLELLALAKKLVAKG